LYDDQDRDVLAYDVEVLLDTLVSVFEVNAFERSGDDVDGAGMWRLLRSSGAVTTVFAIPCFASKHRREAG
jgi:hypothetical protein